MKNNNVKEKLNIFKISLNGINLIEASAGTGKTFTIVLLYLRLLLGIGDNKTCQKKLLIHEILVVTFTNSAKEELYIRIKNGIQNLYLACINKTSEDPVFRLFLQKIKNIKEAIFVLQKAYNNINHISIHTIHSFSQKILQLNNFYSSSIFENTIIENEEELYLKSTQDFWRCYFYNLPENIINIIYQYYSSPECLLKKIKLFFRRKLINFKNKINNQTLILFHEKNIKKINNFKKIWLMSHQKLLQEIDILKINRKVYNKSRLKKWINDITIWSKSDTKDYTIPISLKYFTKTHIEKNTINNICSYYIIFEESEKLLTYNFSFENIILLFAIKKINTIFLKEKKKQSLLSFDDLLNIFLKNLKKEKNLRRLIRKKYPVAFIDEFQDTDIQQYNIFNLIYKNNDKVALFLIGDPKQAIYGFRGADIFSYLYAKSRIKKHFYLDTNWRSSINMCKSINFLFSQQKNTFIFENIPFIPIIPSSENIHMNFTINGIPQRSIRFFLQEKEEVYIDDYRSWIASKCANEISYWLTCAKEKTAKIITRNGKKNLSSNDIAILVRNKKEASIIQEELQKLNIFSIYSSYKNSVFKTFDAQELLWILKSILEPDNEKLLQQSISTHILKKIFNIDRIKSKDTNSYFMIEKLYEYYDIWKKTGIFCMIKNIILEYQKNSNSIEVNENYEKNLNFLHIAELLEEQFQYLNKKKSLVYWFQNKITEKKEPLYNEYVRFINESQTVKIITIHKSKGLEYPVVWIPFSIDFNKSKLSIYHDKKNFKMFFDIKQNKENFKRAEEERLAEDIRFLYVALTRSILHCSIGIACLIKTRKKNKNYSDIHQSGLGCVIQNRDPMNYENLLNKLNELSTNHLIEVKHHINNCKLNINKKNIYLISETQCLDKNIKNIWSITSFTQLKKENKLSINNKEHIYLKNSFKKCKNFTIHNFPRGKETGLLIHKILKKLHSLNTKDHIWFSNILEKYNFSSEWTTTLVFWIKNIINTSLNHEEIILSKIQKRSCSKEFEFFLPIKKVLYNTKLNKIIQSIDPISIISPNFFFNPVTGILKGFIDLFFCWNNKYYIIDYKSNWLGENNRFYCDKYIKKEMIKRRYDLQYQIYTLAIHKYLKSRIKNYDYRNNFGGIFYLFLRAMDDSKKYNGIFYTIPDYSLIEKINFLIS